MKNSLILMAVLFVSACSDPSVVLTDECAWVRPLQFSDQAKSAFTDDDARQYISHNESYWKNCGG